MRRMIRWAGPALAGAVMLAVVTAFGTGPDYWVGMGPGSATQAPPATPILGGTVRREGVVVGNAGGPGQYQQLAMLNVTSEDGTQQVCGISRTIAPPVAGQAVSPIAFQVFFPRGKPVLTLPHLTRYRLVATVAQPNNGAPYEDANTGNNSVTAIVAMPSGGQPSCVQLPTLVIGKGGRP